MIGYYNYTMILTYLSLLSSTTGIIVSLHGPGHPFVGVVFLLLCGLCDAFDGKVARTKKDRTQTEQNFGIQVDSLCDLVAFGVLPACIGSALFRTSPTLNAFISARSYFAEKMFIGLLYGILVLFVLFAMIRLAYFNVTEEERQKTEGNAVRKYYTGLPVTAACLIFPFVMAFQYAFQYLLHIDISIIYFVTAAIVGIAFVGNFKVPKPTLKTIIIMVFIGIAEFAVLLLLWFLRGRV